MFENWGQKKIYNGYGRRPTNKSRRLRNQHIYETYEHLTPTTRSEPRPEEDLPFLWPSTQKTNHHKDAVIQTLPMNAYKQ